MITAPLLVLAALALFSAGWTACEFHSDRLEREAARRRANVRRHMEAVR